MEVTDLVVMPLLGTSSLDFVFVSFCDLESLAFLSLVSFMYNHQLASSTTSNNGIEPNPI